MPTKVNRKSESGVSLQSHGAGLDRGRLPSEILRSGSLEEGSLADRAKHSLLKGIGPFHSFLKRAAAIFLRRAHLDPWAGSPPETERLQSGPLESSEMIIILKVRKGVKTMDKMISCKDLGSECAFTACAETEAELLDQVQEHEKTVHGMKEFSSDFYKKVEESVREGSCGLEEDSNPCECCC